MKRVALIIETSNDYARGLLHGVRQYIRTHEPWSVQLVEQGRGGPPPRWLARFRGDGVIARIENAAVARAVRAAGLPTVDVSAARLLPELPMVETDNRAIARLAADHLLKLGLTELAYCGDPSFGWSRERCQEFKACAASHGIEARVYPPRRSDGGQGMETQRAHLLRWVASLPKPVGVMCCYDICGQQVLDACRELGLAVPDQVAVVGVDNDELLCELCEPSLSSVDLDSDRAGFEAARLLDGMMRGRAAPREPILIKPLRLVARASTVHPGIADPAVSLALRFIHRHAQQNIRVSQVVAATGLGRRTLEIRFRKRVGRTLHEEIARLRMDHARELLRRLDLTVSQVSRRSGFTHPEYFSNAFRKATGLSPSQYRARVVAGREPDLVEEIVASKPPQP